MRTNPEVSAAEPVECVAAHVCAVPALTAQFRRHEPAQGQDHGPFAEVLAGEADRRGGVRAVLVKNSPGDEWSALATWDSEAGRWLVGSELWEDVRVLPTSIPPSAAAE